MPNKEYTPTTKEVVVLATAKAKPGKEAELERVLRQVAAPTRAQRGCLQFDLYRSGQDRDTLTAIERWASKEDHDLHLQGAHVRTLMSGFEGILAAPPEIKLMEPM